MAYIFEYINHEFKGSIRDGNFYDLDQVQGRQLLQCLSYFILKG